MGEMMRGHLGALFVHGMYLKQHWIPGSLTYYYGIMQVRERCLVKFFSVFFFFFLLLPCKNRIVQCVCMEFDDKPFRCIYTKLLCDERD